MDYYIHTEVYGNGRIPLVADKARKGNYIGGVGGNDGVGEDHAEQH